MTAALAHINAPSIRIRRMDTADLTAVATIERDSYGEGWPATAFENELQNNRMARYIVLEEREQVIGFAGLWLIVDEAHVVTVAVAPGERRRGLGRMLVHSLVQLALAEGMESATLEVRVSNEAARALYRTYGFYEVGERKRYYADNGEDAVIMTTEDLGGRHYQERLARLAEAIQARVPGFVREVDGAVIGRAAG